MAFRKISYLIPSCDGCGLAWSFGDPACAEGIPPHFADRAAALALLPADYGWQVTRLRFCPRLMACRRGHRGHGRPGLAAGGGGPDPALRAVRPGPPRGPGRARVGSSRVDERRPAGLLTVL